MTINDAAQETTQAAASPSNMRAPKWFAALGLAAGLGAVVASSCCVVPLALLITATGARADDAGPMKVQVDMQMRIERFVDAFAANNNISQDVRAFCQTDLSLHTARPSDGMIPYGINYRSASPETIKLAIGLR